MMLKSGNIRSPGKWQLSTHCGIESIPDASRTPRSGPRTQRLRDRQNGGQAWSGRRPNEQVAMVQL